MSTRIYLKNCSLKAKCPYFLAETAMGAKRRTYKCKLKICDQIDQKEIIGKPLKHRLGRETWQEARDRSITRPTWQDARDRSISRHWGKT